MHKDVLISQATKRNWSRLDFDNKDIENKLTKRANKRYSQKKIIPLEYFNNQKNIETLFKILEIKADKEKIIYNLAFKMLEDEGLVKNSSNGIESNNEYIKEIFDEYNATDFDILDEIPSPPKDEKDFLGIVYQSLLKEGNKNLQGSYYTPKQITNQLLSKELKKNEIFLDPCCGTGSFLLAVCEKITNPEKIYGFDIDKNACFISKINLILKFKNKKFRPNIFNEDFLLTQKELPKFNAIITNPPWGALSRVEHCKKFPKIKSKESFSYFIVNSWKYLAPNGIMEFVLPESILNVKTHSDVRKFILDNFHIEKINLFGKAFSGVLTNVVSIKLSKKDNEKQTIINSKTQLHINQNFYKSNIHFNFSILDEKDVKILQKIYSKPYQTLKNSIWALGIVTGNNAKHISIDSNFGEKIYTGKNIQKEIISDTNKYIKYDREKFQQVASDEIYRAKEKLVYKFISTKLVFAYDNSQRLFLNSANILIPKIDGYSTKDVMQMLNSELFQYIYSKKFNELKVLKGNLSELPFPIKSSNSNLTNEIIFQMFNLSKDEISYIKSQL